jgi:hypothetical protein
MFHKSVTQMPASWAEVAKDADKMPNGDKGVVPRADRDPGEVDGALGQQSMQSNGFDIRHSHSNGFAIGHGSDHRNGHTNDDRNGHGADCANGYSNGHGGAALETPDSFLEGKAVRTVYGPVPLKHALDWPIFASYDELVGCAAWMGGRIPTFEEARSIYVHADALKKDVAERQLGKTVPAVNA